MRRPRTYLVASSAAALVGAAATLLFAFREGGPRVDDVLAAYREGGEYGGLDIVYPLDGALFPPEIVPPRFRWKDADGGAGGWVVTVDFPDAEGRMSFVTRTAEWTPTDREWEAIRRRSTEKDARVTVIGVKRGSSSAILSAGSISISTSKDPVGAPLFYREVNLPFVDAVKDPSRIRWRFGVISSKTGPPTVLENLPVCGNCHSFSSDGAVLGMDVDYANDKGSYAIARIEEEMVLDKSKIMTWSDFRREDKELTFGLLSQVSPDGNHVVSTVKDRSVFVPRPGIEFSQLFFPIKGILAVYSRRTRTFSALPGADDREYVNSNPDWSPDGKHLVFTRGKAHRLRNVGSKVLLTEEECREFLEEGKTFRFELYRIPFNDGKGGTPAPLEGASRNGMSNYFPKHSPDGKWIVFCKARSFSLLQPDSKLFIMPAEGGEPREMRCNTSRMNSWHSWSPNGRWLVFASKAFSPYTQLFLTHVDEEGRDTPPVLLDHLTSPDRAANIPEFVNAGPGAIRAIRERFVDDVSFVRAAQEFLEGGDLGKAAGAYRKALEINPRNSKAHTGLATALDRQGRTGEAIAHYTEAVRVGPNDAVAHYNLGVVFDRQNRIPEALRHYAEALRLDPDDVAVHYNMGVVFGRLGEVEKSVHHYTEALRLDPRHAKSHNNLAIVLQRQGRNGEALDHYLRVVELEPGHSRARNNAGTILLAQGRDEEAILHLTEAVRTEPDYAKARSNLGVALQKRGRMDEAIVHLTEAVRLEPDYAKAHSNLGVALQKQGRIEEAIDHYTKALAIDPDSALVRHNLDVLLRTREAQERR